MKIKNLLIISSVLIGLVFVLLSTTHAYLIDGDTVYIENQYGRITATPIVSRTTNNHQDVEICSKLDSSVKVNWTFSFPEKVLRAKVYHWRTGNYVVDDWGTCQGNHTEYNNVTEEYETQFFNYSCIIGNHTEYGLYRHDITNKFNYKTRGGVHHYYILNTNFDALECKNISYYYTTPFGHAGKYNITIQSGEKIIFLDPAYNNTIWVDDFEDGTVDGWVEVDAEGGSWGVSSDVASNGTYSLRYEPADGTNIYLNLQNEFMDNTGHGKSENGTLSFYIYDAEPTDSTASSIVMPKDGTSVKSFFGVDTEISTEYYKCWTGVAYAATNIARSSEWIYIEITVNESGSYLWGNGTWQTDCTALTGAGTAGGKINLTRIGNAPQSGGKVYFDEFRFYNTSIPSPYADEEEGDSAIVTGINNAISGATIYSDQQIYVSNLANNQDLGTFDKVASYGNQRWAFNYVTDGDPTSGFTNMFNLTPTFYVLEMEDMTSSEITTEVETFINATKT